ncbi:uncharacterized protein LOC127806978 isoform X2 [Diospyros lotus]|uniref:uncharacterized protein LOC127806978 isoform X2 n=1 Tax=Diospyros lotus TaxID=55363 RepID=UPI002259D2B7|nr:uncharacterized protein LOC127806978 isoform X2 [Diospyros lotus]
MERKSNISHYRGRLDKTLTSYDLENEEGLKVLVKKQILQSSHCEIEEYLENIVERRTKDVINFLQMLKSASANDYEVSKSRETPRSGWKLKQDTEDYRVMYRQGPQGTPFHTLLVEGYVDGPLDVCLCISWESTLFNKWWPQTNIPTFKIISSDCLQKVRIGEQISLVRMKVPWPLSAREVVVHFFEFEYFQDDLIVVLLNSISDLESIDRSTHGFSKDGIPDAQDVVRIDVVGGFALQKVTADRSYFRTIANFDMKLDFVPPSFINFVSRQLIGSGFRLYKKEVASVSRGDEDFGKALKDQLYNRIREILYSDNKQKRALELGDTKNDVETFHEEHVLEVLSDHHATETFPEDAVVEYDHHATGTFSEDAVVEDHIAIIEIEEIAEEDIEQSGHLEEGGKQISNRTTTQIEEKPCVNNKIIGVSPQVKQALETLDKVISICREYRLGPQTRSPEFTHKGSFDVGKNREKELRSLGNGQICASDQACVDALKNETVERALHEPRNSSSSHCSSLFQAHGVKFLLKRDMP